MADTLQQLFRERAGQDNVAVKYGDRTWTWREHVAEASAQAAAIIDIADTCRPLHVGVLLANTPDMLTAMASSHSHADNIAAIMQAISHARRRFSDNNACVFLP